MIPESITFTESVELDSRGNILNRWPKASIKMTLESPSEVNEATEYAMRYVQDTLKKAADLSKNYFTEDLPTIQEKDR